MIIWCIAVKCHYIGGREEDKTNVISRLLKHTEKITLSYSSTDVSLVIKPEAECIIKKI